jgi:hypothetical protein
MKKSLLTGSAALAVLLVTMFTACGDDDPSSPKPPADLKAAIQQTVTGDAGSFAVWVGDVDLKTALEYDSANKEFTVSYNGVDATITLDEDYTDAPALLAAINAALSGESIGLVADWDGNNLKLTADAKGNNGNIVVGGDDVSVVLNTAAGTDDAGSPEAFETYVITISGESAQKNYDLSLVVDTATTSTTGVIDVPSGTKAAQVATAIAAEINDSTTPSDLYSFLDSDYTTSVSSNTVTITADSSATTNDYTNTIAFTAK